MGTIKIDGSKITFPDLTEQSTSAVDTRVATVVVAAYNSLHPEKADYRCDGVDDHVEIQAALNSLPSTGGQVVLLDGTFNVQSTIGRNISNITIRGQGKSTVLTTSTSNLTFLSFTGASGSELTGITISDMVIDGNGVANYGIYFNYVNKSTIQNVVLNATSTGINLANSNFNVVTANTCANNIYYGIYLNGSANNYVIGNNFQANNYIHIRLDLSNNNTISNNMCGSGCQYNNIYIYSSSMNTIIGNIIQGNTDGMFIYSSSNYNIIANNYVQSTGTGIDVYASNNNVIVGNVCKGNGVSGIAIYQSNYNTIDSNICIENSYYGIYVYNNCNHNNIVGNTCIANSQSTNNGFDNIYLASASYNNIQGNICRAGILTNKPRYGINIANSAATGNLVTNNDIYNDGFGTGSFNNVGTNTVTAAGNRT